MECRNTQIQKPNFKHKTEIKLAPFLLGLVGFGLITAESRLKEGEGWEHLQPAGKKYKTSVRNPNECITTVIFLPLAAFVMQCASIVSSV